MRSQPRNRHATGSKAGRHDKRRGVAATEFAVCLPVMVLLVLGMIETCSAIFLKQSLSIAAYEGAHTAVAPNATNGDILNIAQSILADRNVRGGRVQVLPGNVVALQPGTPIEVRVTAPSDGNTLISGRFFRGRELTASAFFVKET